MTTRTYKTPSAFKQALWLVLTIRRGWFMNSFVGDVVFCPGTVPTCTTGTVPTCTMQPFHLAFPVHDLAAARQFYVEVLGCSEGRSSDEWVDFNLYGHQVVAHLVVTDVAAPTASNSVDDHDVPVPHFGVVLGMNDWQQLADRLKASGVTFLLEPQIRFAGKVGEQATMFFRDPSGNALEFKAFADPEQLFAK